MRLWSIAQLIFVAVAGALPSVALADPPAEEKRYTEFDRGVDVSWPSNTRRIALLIGNSVYEAIGEDQARPRAAPLPDLRNPCNDAKLVGANLARIGWKRDEIALLCNQSTADMTAALNKLLRVTPSSPEEAKLVVIYLAGHGMAVNEFNYFFGVDARVDFHQAAQNLVNEPRRPLFPDESLDLIAHFRGKLGPNVKTPILLIIDACRDNPMYREMANSYREAYRAASESKRALASSPRHTAISGPSAAGLTPPRGMVVAFANVAGAVVADDLAGENGQLAASFAKTLREERSVNSVLSDLIQDVMSETNMFPPEKQQIPDTIGTLLADPTAGDWCFYGCRLPGVTALFARPIQLVTNGPTIGLLAAQEAPPQAVQTPDVAHKVQARPSDAMGPKGRDLIFHTNPPANKRPYTLEVFWCETGTPEDQARQALARELAEGVARRARQGFDGARGARYEYVWLSRLPPDQNILPENQWSTETIVVDSEDEVETEFAKHIKEHFDTHLTVVSRRGATAGYVSAYMCGGAYPEARATRVYVQVPNYTALSLGSKLIEVLDHDHHQLAIAPKAERVSNAPEETQIRYFAQERHDDAMALANTVQRVMRRPVTVKYLGTYNKTGARQLEVWVGKKDADVKPLPSLLLAPS